MGRTKKTETAEIEEQNPIENPEPETPEKADETPKKEEETPAQEEPIQEEIEKVIPANVLELMRLYSQYEKIWVTPKGFVHPEKTPKYLLEGATLYTNKFYNN